MHFHFSNGRRRVASWANALRRAAGRNAFAFLLAAPLLAALPTNQANAASFTVRGDTITMTGTIGAADPLRLAELIARGARTIVLESPGGIVAAGAYMAEMIRRADLETVVSGDCASACTMMYYAGTRRALHGRLGFHNASDAAGTAQYVAEIRRFGAPPEAIHAVLTTPADGITWLR
jgi:hypothetical protein